MLPELRRTKQKLSQEECIRLLTTETRGVLSVQGEDGYPYGMPITHWYEPEDGCIYFHTGKRGHRCDSLARCDKVSFCVFDKGQREEGEWAYKVKSVIVFGRVQRLEDRDTIVDICAKLCRKFTDDESFIQKEIDAFADATLLLRLVPEQICGKLVTES